VIAVSKNLIIGTAGHIDHGKTTLIKALTGDDTDRLQAEKKRGISIELGFSCLNLGNDLKVGIIDVPGHEKFIKNMLAGAGGVDLALLVVAADEAIMPQTEEHLAILELLNVKAGIVAVTKSDLVEPEWLELVVTDIKEQFSDTFLAAAPVIPVSAVTGTGIVELKLAIKKLVDNFPAKSKKGNVYFPVDRVFSVSGHGTVVTGTLISGKIELEDSLTIYPEELKVRVRSLQVHEQDVSIALPGQRVGINLAGIDKNELKRGDILATNNTLRTTNYLDARLKLLESTPFVLKHGDQIRLHLGAREVLGRVYLLNKYKLKPGETAFVQFKLVEEIVANFKERYIIRRHSPMTTIGGGEILATKPHRHRKFDSTVLANLEIMASGSPAERVALSLQSSLQKTSKLNYLVKTTGLSPEELLPILSELTSSKQAFEFKVGQESTWLHKNQYENLKEEILNQLATYHSENHLDSGILKEELRTRLSIKLSTAEYNLLVKELVSRGLLYDLGAELARADFKIKLTYREAELKNKILAAYQAGFLQPPTLDNLISDILKADSSEYKLIKKLINLLLRQGELIQVSDELIFLPTALAEAKQVLINYLQRNQKIELAEYRDLLDSSRKYALALLDYFDQQKITKRQGNQRILIK
jgi:selenocysteine-specific elongation factor